MNGTMQRMADSEGLKLLERLLVPLLVAAVVGGFGLVLRNQSQQDTKIDEIGEAVQDQAISSAVYRERVDKLQTVQTTLSKLADNNRTELQQHDYRIGAVERRERQQASELRPNR